MISVVTRMRLYSVLLASGVSLSEVASLAAVLYLDRTTGFSFKAYGKDLKYIGSLKTFS